MGPTVFGDLNSMEGDPFDEPGTSGGFAHCEEPGAYDIITKFPGPPDSARVNAIDRGMASSIGAPAAPTIVDMNAVACYCWFATQPQILKFGAECVQDDCCTVGNCCWDVNDPESCDMTYLPDQFNARVDKEWVWSPGSEKWTPTGDELGMYAYIDWEPNQESDLAGYHIEMAGSTEGPWVRLTSHPIAWWETHFDARLWTEDYPNTDPEAHPNDFEWVGPDCAVFRVIAVDEAGNESLENNTFQVAPVPESNRYNQLLYPVEEVDCSAGTPTLEAPQNLTAEDDTGGTKLTWDRVQNAAAYRVYRKTIVRYTHYRFYVTAVIVDDPAGNDCDDTTCTFTETGEALGCPWTSQFGCDLDNLDAFYVTAIESADPGVMPRESLRSDIVLWRNLQGYAWNLGDTEDYDALASLEHPVSPEGLWCEEPVMDNACEGADLARDPLLAQSVPPNPSVAPLLTLGQTSICNGCDIYDLHVDLLGSTRVITDNDGIIVSQHDYLPFGEEITPVFTYNTKMFTGHERDSETGLDYMLARYYGNNLPRFLAPDPGENWDKFEPQTWNLYTYVGNNPLRYFDPTGEEMRDVREVNAGKQSTFKLGARAKGGGFLRFDINTTADSLNLSSLSSADIIVEVVDAIDIGEGVVVTDELMAAEEEHVAAFREAFAELRLEDLDLHLLSIAERLTKKGNRKGWSDDKIRDKIKEKWQRLMNRKDRKLFRRQQKKHDKLDASGRHDGFEMPIDSVGCQGRLRCI
jgi:RHS repeat-associated protein